MTAAPDLAEARLAEARRALRENFGHEDFWTGQAEILEVVLAGRDALAVMPTGSGKSLLYQLPAAMGLGLVVVVSPLISLMQDQLRAMSGSGVAAFALHSGQNEREAAAAKAAVAAGRAQLLYLAPERLALEQSLDALRDARPRLFAVDEAHCVSHWGHEFRPDYAALGAAARRLGGPPILAVTATAGAKTREDIVASLFPARPRIFVHSFARKNLRLNFRRRQGGLRQIVDVLARHRGDSGIVYCASRQRTGRMASDLRRLGFDALAYHAGLDAAERAAHQEAFFQRPGVVMVATIAFGMGVDKPDVRFVVHADMPGSIEGYYQEIGRAGRDGAPAEALLLFDPRELAMRWRIPPGAPEDSAAFAESRRRRAMAQLAAAPGCRFRALLAGFDEESARCGRCDHCRGGALALPRRLVALGYAARARLESRLQPPGDDAIEESPPVAAPLVAVGEGAPAGALLRPALRVREARLLLRLKEERLKLARRRRVAPHAIASEAFLEALALARPEAAGHALFAEGEGAGLAPEEARALLRVVADWRSA